MKLDGLFVVLAFFYCLLSPPLYAAEWPPISPEDLKMTSLSEQPGAAAVVLDREETDNDMLNVRNVYMRIKVLTDAGREYANVEIPYNRRGFRINDVSGRTTHADGSVVEFQGKPFDKTVVKAGGIKINEKSFTLPDVQVGSIIDYRYSLAYDDNRVLPPTWYVQSDLFQRKAYFKFIPFQNRGNMEIILPHGRVSSGVAWMPFLGNGFEPKLHRNQALVDSPTSYGQASSYIDLAVNNVPALVDEPYMPPSSITEWRVYFYYQEDLKTDDYWKREGKFWNKDVESFVGKDHGVRESVNGIVAASDTPEQKVRKIYGFVAALENQDYIPERTVQEEKVLQLKENKGAEDVLQHRSGTHDELNRLFIAMVRAAGIPASLIWVPDRSREIFIKQYMSTNQFDAEIAIVQLNGKDVFLDPGTKFCPYGVLDWRYSDVSGLRQTSKGAEIGQTGVESYKDYVITRMFEGSLDEHGVLSGRVALVFKAIAAMQLRQEGGKTDAEGRKKLLEDQLRAMLPGNSDLHLINAPDWDNSEQPLIAQFHVSFPFAVSAGKRLVLAQHLFQVNEKPLFPAVERTSSVYFRFLWQEADEVHIQLPSGMEAESLAPDDTVKLPYALYRVQQKQEAPGKIFSRRDLVVAQGVFTPKEYKQVKGFFDKIKSDDDQPALVKVVSHVATAN